MSSAYISTLARQVIIEQLAMFNQRIEDFDIWLALAGNICNLCARVSKGRSVLADNDSVYVIVPKGDLERMSYPQGFVCTTHGMLAWQEAPASKTLCTVSGEVAEVPTR